MKKKIAIFADHSFWRHLKFCTRGKCLSGLTLPQASADTEFLRPPLCPDAAVTSSDPLISQEAAGSGHPGWNLGGAGLFCLGTPQIHLVGVISHPLFFTLLRHLLRGNSEKATAPHSSTLAWKIQGRGSLLGCRLWGRTELDMTEET